MKISGAAERIAGIIALVVGLSMLIGAAPAGAVDGQPLLAGLDNTESASTFVGEGSSCANVGSSAALVGCGEEGVEGDGPIGLHGLGSQDGVKGDTDTGTGVFGTSSGSTGIGVEGENDGSGSAIYGVTDLNGVGVFGDAPTSGTGVIARSTNGNALDVRGKATFSRSGLITVAAGSSGRTVTLSGVTKASMVLATAQQDGAVYVRSAVPGNGQFTVHLTGPAPTGGLKVSYFVLN
jgi:hypothetical protein